MSLARASAAGLFGLGGAAAEQVLDRLPVAMPEHGKLEALLDDVLGHAVAHQARRR